MTSKEEVMKWVVLALQSFVGFWQILKLTPLGAVLQSAMAAWLLPYFRLSQTYARLKELHGRVFKTVKCHVFTELPYNPRGQTDDIHEINLSYLGRKFHLDRKENILSVESVEGKMAYYITEKIWQELLVVEADCRDSKCAVFLKGYKLIWEQVATARVMSFSEILDSVIIEGQYVRTIQDSTCQLLPVDLTVSAESLLKFINLVSVFMGRKEDYWLIAAVLSCTSAVLEFSSRLRTLLYRNLINRGFCFIMQKIVDRLPRSMRRHVYLPLGLYSLGLWVENLKPCNDIQLKVVRGNIRAIIAGGAKAENSGAIRVPWLQLEEGQTKKTFHCASTDIDIVCKFEEAIEEANNEVIEANNEVIEEANNEIEEAIGEANNEAIEEANNEIEEANNRCVIQATTFPDFVRQGVGRDDFNKIMTLVDSIARNGCGTLKSYDPKNNKVRVRGLLESINDYSINYLPDIYELELNNVIM